MERFTPTDRSTLKRLPKRGEYGREGVYQILDEGFVCHVGFVVDGAPVVLPHLYARVGETVNLHGSTGARAFRNVWPCE